MRRVVPLLLGVVAVGVGGCAGSQNDRHAEPYALLIPNGETAPDPLPEKTTVIEAEPPGEQPSMDPIARRLTQARRLYRDLAFEASLEELARAEQSLETKLEWQQTYTLLDRMLLLRGLDELALGRPERARDAFRQAALLRPDRVGLDPAEFSPEVRSEYGRARQPLATEAPFALSIESNPSGTELLVDGSVASRTPASVRLHRGRHYLVLRAPGYQTETRVIDVDEHTAPIVRFELEPLSDLRLAGELAELHADAFAGLDSTFRLRLVPAAGEASPVHLGRSDSGWTAALVDRGSGDIRAKRVSSVPSLELATPALVDALRDAPQEKPLVRQGWFWTVIGAVVVGTTLGLYFGLRKQPEAELVIAGP